MADDVLSADSVAPNQHLEISYVNKWRSMSTNMAGDVPSAVKWCQQIWLMI